MSTHPLIIQAQDIAVDIMGVCEQIFTIEDKQDLVRESDELLALAVRLDNFVQSKINAPRVGEEERNGLQ